MSTLEIITIVWLSCFLLLLMGSAYFDNDKAMTVGNLLLCFVLAPVIAPVAIMSSIIQLAPDFMNMKLWFWPKSWGQKRPGKWRL